MIKRNLPQKTEVSNYSHNIHIQVIHSNLATNLRKGGKWVCSHLEMLVGSKMFKVLG